MNIQEIIKYHDELLACVDKKFGKAESKEVFLLSSMNKAYGGDVRTRRGSEFLEKEKAWWEMIVW